MAHALSGPDRPRERQEPPVHFVPSVVDSSDGIHWRIPEPGGLVPLPDRLLPNQVGAAPLNRFGEWGPCYYDDRAQDPRQRVKGFVLQGPRTRDRKEGLLDRDLPRRADLERSGRSALASLRQRPRRLCLLEPLPRQLRAGHPSQERRPAHRPDGNPGLEGVLQGRAGLVPRWAGSRPGRALRDAHLPLRQPVHRIALGLPDPAADLPARQFLGGRIDCQLAYSYDGWHFQRGPGTAAGQAAPGRIGAGCTCPAA